MGQMEMKEARGFGGICYCSSFLVESHWVALLCPAYLLHGPQHTLVLCPQCQAISLPCTGGEGAGGHSLGWECCCRHPQISVTPSREWLGAGDPVQVARRTLWEKGQWQGAKAPLPDAQSWVTCGTVVPSDGQDRE